MAGCPEFMGHEAGEAGGAAEGCGRQKPAWRNAESGPERQVRWKRLGIDTRFSIWF